MDHQAIGAGGILHLLFSSGRDFIVVSGHKIPLVLFERYL
jgi:hypothetical protein